MQHEPPRGRSSVDRIAGNGRAHMGKLHASLVHATGFEHEIDVYAVAR